MEHSEILSENTLTKINFNSNKILNFNTISDYNSAISFLNSHKSLELIYIENFIENLSKAETTELIKKCYSSLITNGKIRIATIDIEQIIYKYSVDWNNQLWITNKKINFEDKIDMINDIFSRYKFLYNEDSLKNIFNSYNFKEITRFEFGRSGNKDLWNLEQHPESTLILEAIKA